MSSQSTTAAEVQFHLEKLRRNLFNECYLISKGVRSCMQMTVVGLKEANDDCPGVADMLFDLEQVGLHYNLRSLWFKYKDQSDVQDGFEAYSFWVYRYSHQLPIIKAVEEADSKGKSILLEWIIGKLLGYSDDAMEQYLVLNVMNEVKTDTTVLKQD